MPEHAGDTPSPAADFLFPQYPQYYYQSWIGVYRIGEPRQTRGRRRGVLSKGNRAIYKFGASDERFQHLRPNNLVLWEAIALLAREGFEDLHLGRTSLGNEGLRRFKLSWGTTEETIRYFRFGQKMNESEMTRDRVSGFHNGFFKALPLSS